MSNGTTSFAGNFAYIAPGSVQVNEAIAASASYEDSAVGFVDVPDSTVAETVFTIPMGTIGSVTAFFLENKTGQEMGVRINAASADEFNLPNNGKILYSAPSSPASVPITALKLVTTALQSGAGKIEYRIFGDT